MSKQPVKSWVLSPRCSWLPLQHSSAAFLLPDLSGQPDTTQQEATALLLGIAEGETFSPPCWKAQSLTTA